MSNPEQSDTLHRVIERLSESPDDPEAWRSLYVTLWPYVLATNNRLLGGRADYAEDASQEVFLRLFQYGKLTSLRSRGAARAYVRTICRNVVRSYLKQLRNQAHTTDLIEEYGHEGSGLSDEEAVARDLKEYLEEPLSDSERQLLELTVDGYGLHEIAERLHINYSNAAVRLHRLRQKISKFVNLKNLREAS
jgi:RNA polymerase sigma factor (sigma-70 family)